MTQKTSTSRVSKPSVGFLLFGMHRSGTSALAGMLHKAGVDAGERLVPASAGNEGGHWEDAFAVEANERLLAEFGRRWDDVRPLPPGWLNSEAALSERERITGYLRSSRLRQPAWLIKDPRMCVLAELWLAAAAEAEFTPSVLLMARHPREVMDSLHVRDGMPHAQSALLWMRHMLYAERLTRTLPRIVLTYDQLLDAPARVLDRVRALGGGKLPRKGQEFIKSIRNDARHHRGGSDLSSPLGEVWQAFRQGALTGELDHGLLDAAAEDLHAADRWYAPVLTETRRQHQTLWERTARAEAALAESALATSTRRTDGVLDELRSRLESVFAAGFEEAVSAISGDLRKTQEEHTGGVEKAVSAISGDLRRTQEEHAAGIEKVISAISGDLQKTQEEHAGGVEKAISAISGDLRRTQEEHAAGIEKVISAISGDLRRMQEEHARAISKASDLSAKVNLAQELKPALQQLDDGLSQLNRSITLAVQEEIRLMRAEVRRTQQAHAQALAQSASAASDAALGRQMAPVLAELGVEIRRLNDEREALRRELRETLESVARTRRELGVAECKLLDLEHARQQARSEADQLTSRLHEQGSELDAARRGRDELSAMLKEQQSWRAHLERRLADRDADFAQVVGSRSWRITKPVRVLARLLRREDAPEERRRVRRWLSGSTWLPRWVRPSAPRPGLPAPVGDASVHGLSGVQHKPDVFIWAVIDWHFRTQRPQHLARGLSEAGHRVFYLSNNLVDSPEPGFAIETLDENQRLFQVFLHAEGAPAIYFGGPSPETVQQLTRSVGELMQWADSHGGLCIVQHPFWSDIAAAVSGSALLYDCMDHHAGFENNAPDVLAAEAALTRAADLLIVTSDWLDRELAAQNPNRALIRNACDFEHFRTPPREHFADRQGRRVIGYFGAIAEWFDVALVRAIARAFPDCVVLLVGSDTAGVGGQLADEANVLFTGEVPYQRLPYYLYGFDVALLPFRVIPLTLATNPVKVYEYLSAGKPVVTVDLPEIAQFGDMVYRASDASSFVAYVRAALDEQDSELEQERRSFASHQTWSHRAEELDSAIAAMTEPLVTVVVLTYNNLDFTKACLHSLVAESNWRNLEIVVVDNASTDGTPGFLREWVDAGPGRKIVLNEHNLGFSAGNNVGLAAASGEYLILLNNDTYVTPNWVRTMVNHLVRHPEIGILGPVTNNIGNEARIDIQYSSMEEMRLAAAAYTRRHLGQLFDIATVAFFCVALPRSTYEAVGPMDEDFGVGFFEDDDYCRRVEAAGLRVVCAEDVFIHHHLSASFDALKAERKQELFQRNRAIYEAKWGPWVPHVYRGQAAGGDESRDSTISPEDGK